MFSAAERARDICLASFRPESPPQVWGGSEEILQTRVLFVCFVFSLCWFCTLSVLRTNKETALKAFGRLCSKDNRLQAQAARPSPGPSLSACVSNFSRVSIEGNKSPEVSQESLKPLRIDPESRGHFARQLSNLLSVPPQQTHSRLFLSLFLLQQNLPHLRGAGKS